MQKMTDFYESDQAVSEYLLFHYGDPDLQMPWPQGPRIATDFPARCVETGLGRDPLPAQARALELGCAVGRAAFELSKSCADVVAFDRSEAFIAAARRLQRESQLSFFVAVEGTLTEPATARLPPGSRPSKVRFEVGDALDLPADLGTFDVVLAANLLDRLPKPASFLRNLPSLIRPGGRLILTSPYTWLEAYTPRTEWLGTEGRRTSECLQRHLPDFTLLRRADLPFVIREHSRKFQWSVAEATVWLRNTSG
jgi:putative 4-mercaptohistidine N1-methyltranferase